MTWTQQHRHTDTQTGFQVGGAVTLYMWDADVKLQWLAPLPSVWPSLTFRLQLIWCSSGFQCGEHSLTTAPAARHDKGSQSREQSVWTSGRTETPGSVWQLIASSQWMQFNRSGKSVESQWKEVHLKYIIPQRRNSPRPVYKLPINDPCEESNTMSNCTIYYKKYCYKKSSTKNTSKTRAATHKSACKRGVEG